MRTSAVAVTGILVGSLATWAAIHFGSPGPPTGEPPKKPQHKNEYSLIVLKDVNGTCMVKEKRPQTIFTESSSTVTWIVVGSCANGATVSIDHQFTVAGSSDTKDVFVADANLSTTAQDGNKISGVLKSNLTPDGRKVLYYYTILINGQPAEYQSRADQGDFMACPAWPC